MKKVILFSLSLMLLLLCAAPLGCAGAMRGSGIEVCTKFLRAVNEGSYGTAFDLIADSLKNTTGVPTEGDAAMISYSEFVDKYESIFNAIGVTDIVYDITSSAEGSSTATVAFTMSYYTEKAGVQTNDYTINARYENRKWGVQWSPALIFRS